MRIFAPTKAAEMLRINAGVVKLVDTPDLGSGALRCVGSSPITRTKASHFGRLFLFLLHLFCQILWIWALRRIKSPFQYKSFPPPSYPLYPPPKIRDLHRRETSFRWSLFPNVQLSGFERRAIASIFNAMVF